jgi:Subtilase family
MSSPPPYWWEPGQEAQRAARKSLQVGEIQRAFSGAGVDVGIFPNGPGQNMEYMFRRRTLLVRTSALGTVMDAIRARGLTSVTASAGRVPGIAALALPSSFATADDIDLLEGLSADLGQGIVMPDHIVHVTPAGACAATEPTLAVLQATPKPTPIPNPQPVSAVVVDTGFLPGVKANTPWLANSSGGPESGRVGLYRGHGTFVAGVLATEAVSATIKVEPLMFAHGAVVESSLAEALINAVGSGPQIISMSAGTTTANGQPPIALEAVCRKIQNSQTILFAAAGNDMSGTERFYPAAFAKQMDHVVSVGALDVNGAQAGYSNYGDWVGVWARGSEVVNAYPNGVYLYGEPPYGPNEIAVFTNWLATWSGTSFATPIVAGRVAAYLAKNGGTPKAALDAVLQAAPKTGPGGKPALFP